MRNVEIKAVVHNSKEFLEKVKVFVPEPTKIFKQVDYFFNCDTGRLKLRIQNYEQNGQLIFYQRDDQSGPKLSNYSITPIADAASLMKTLYMALKLKGKVEKTRTLYMYGQTRIHYDKVEHLGTFMELEVVLDEHQTVEEGQQIAQYVMDALGIKESDLITNAYVDMLINNKNQIPK